MYEFTREELDLATIQKRIAAMDDDQLKEYGRAAAAMAERSSRATWRVQLDEARAEWRRRHRRAPAVLEARQHFGRVVG